MHGNRSQKNFQNVKTSIYFVMQAKIDGDDPFMKNLATKYHAGSA